MKNLVSSVCMIIIVALTMPQYLGAENQTFVFTYDYEGASHDFFGIQRRVQIDAAMRIKDPLLVGSEILGVSVDIPTKEGCSCDPAASAWMTRELRVDGEFNQPDLIEVSGTITNYGTEESPELRLDVTFPEPYTLTEEGVYVGYSVNVTDCNIPGVGWTAKYPIVTVCDIDKPESFMIHCTKGASTLPQKYPEWVDLNESTSQALAMRVVMSGKKHETAANLQPQQTLYVAPGTTGYVYANLYNYGNTPISSIEYTYTLGENGATPHTVTNKMVLDTPVPGQTGAFGIVDLPIEAPDATGRYSASIHVNKVNDMDNGYNGASALDIEVVPFLPVHSPLVEDYTGLWCGYCPAVYVTVKQLQDKYGTDFLPISYHVDDVLQSVETRYFASDTYGLPKVYVEDRLSELSYDNIEKTWLRLRRELAPAEINVKLYWEDRSRESLRAESTVRFVYDEPDATYMLAYAMVEDGMSGPELSQRNFYTNYNYDGAYWDLFCGQHFVVEGLVYDDVVVSCPEPSGVKGSLPSIIDAEVDYNHTYVLNLKDATRKASVGETGGQSIIKDPNKLRVVVMLIDGDTGNVVNATSSVYSAEAEVIDNNSIFETGLTEPSVLREEYYTFEGSRLASTPESGGMIIVRHMTDGSVRTEKTVR